MAQSITNVKGKGMKGRPGPVTQDNIISYLRAKYNPNAILLHGSRARGDAVENSDYDLVLITEDLIHESKKRIKAWGKGDWDDVKQRKAIKFIRPSRYASTGT
ncbi:MAG: nucleotidyltransferase domain-containing protein [Alphaproteobacteria bacterium]|nr:nucleotidyltransferase domain-containing protein [Alphaproteobacteria bacterium]